MKSLFGEMGETYTLSADGMYYPDLVLSKEDTGHISELDDYLHFPWSPSSAFRAWNIQKSMRPQTGSTGCRCLHNSHSLFFRSKSLFFSGIDKLPVWVFADDVSWE